MESYLILQKGEKLFLLLKNPADFHLICVDKRLTEQTEARLLEIYPCSDTTLRELGVNFQRISPRGVAIGGNEAGDPIILYIGKEKRKYVLSDDYAPELLEAFFSGVERFQPPKNKHKKNPDAWRLAEQDPAKLPNMKRIKVLLTAVSIGSSILLLLDPLWGVLGILSSLACVVLDIVFPAYFTLLDSVKGRKPKHAIGLSIAATVPLMAQSLYIMSEVNYLVWWEIWLWSLALSVLLGCLIGYFAREFKNRKGDLAAVFLLLALFCQGPVGLLNHALDTSEPYVCSVQVEDKYVSDSSKGSDRYYLTIYLEDGTEFDLQVSRSQYEELAVGDEINVASRSGGLGIEYIALVET